MHQGDAFPTTEDAFLGGRVVVRQPKDGYRAGSDPMFLAAAVPVRHNGDGAGERVLDLGCGVGTASLALLARLGGVHVTGLELQPALAELARFNAERNGFAERFTIIEGCLTTPPKLIRSQGFDHVITNPPWYEAHTIRAPATETKAIGHVEGEVDLADWLMAAVKYLKPKGHLFIVHRADRLGDILAGLKPLKIGEIRVFPLWPKPGRAATRVVVAARKDAKTPLEVLPGLMLHHEDGGYTDRADDVLRRAAPLF